MVEVAAEVRIVLMALNQIVKIVISSLFPGQKQKNSIVTVHEILSTLYLSLFS